MASALNVEQRGSMQRMIRWNKISTRNRCHHRNLKNACSVFLRIRDKLSLSQPVIEKAAFYYRKTLLECSEGKIYQRFRCSRVYIACRETGMVRSMEEISKSIDTNQIFSAANVPVFVNDDWGSKSLRSILDRFCLA